MGLSFSHDQLRKELTNDTWHSYVQRTDYNSYPKDFNAFHYLSKSNAVKFYCHYDQLHKVDFDKLHGRFLDYNVKLFKHLFYGGYNFRVNIHDIVISNDINISKKIYESVDFKKDIKEQLIKRNPYNLYDILGNDISKLGLSEFEELNGGKILVESERAKIITYSDTYVLDDRGYTFAFDNEKELSGFIADHKIGGLEPYGNSRIGSDFVFVENEYHLEYLINVQKKINLIYSSDSNEFDIMLYKIHKAGYKYVGNRFYRSPNC